MHLICQKRKQRQQNSQNVLYLRKITSMHLVWKVNGIYYSYSLTDYIFWKKHCKTRAGEKIKTKEAKYFRVYKDDLINLGNYLLGIIKITNLGDTNLLASLFHFFISVYYWLGPSPCWFVCFFSYRDYIIIVITLRRRVIY